MGPIFGPDDGERRRKELPIVTLDQRISRFVPVAIAADIRHLPHGERLVLRHLIRAARRIDGLFLEQVWAGNTALLLELAADRSPAGQEELRYFLMNKGPWSRLDDQEIFVRGTFDVPEKPRQAGFYPADASREDVEAWIATLSQARASVATGFFSVIRRDDTGAFHAVPYRVAYHDALTAVAADLRAAAAATGAPSLRRFLDARADAMLSDEYYDSDLAWMHLDAPIEPTLGPYETYEDEWFGYKAAFEAFIAIRDDAETARLSTFGSHLQDIESALPIDPRYRNPALGALAPIRVVNLIFSAGDGNRGVQTAAFNLPNDERIIREHGAKRVMLKNVQEAKFRHVLVPIARAALDPADFARLSFDAFFAHILLHELMHGLGPHQVHDDGRPVRLALKDTYAALEEAKADISGLWALQFLADRGVISAEIAGCMYRTFLAGAFRTLRFGINEAHGRGMAIQFNSLLDARAFVVRTNGTFAIDDERIRFATADLTGRIMTIQAHGDYDAAARMIELATIRPEVQHVLDRLGDIPVDIAPDFPTAREIEGR
ncbi:MAG: hypothetical protein ABI634_09495 [Acidobacteriota bacterium]